MQSDVDGPAHPRADEFRAFIKDPPFPCVGAKSALSRGRMVVVAARVTALESGVATVTIDATCGGVKVLGQARAEVSVA